MNKPNQIVAALILIFAWLVADSVRSQDGSVGVYESAQDLTKGCRSFLRFRQTGKMVGAQEAFDAAECWGYVVGILDKTSVDAATSALTPTGVPPPFCLGPNVNANDAVEVVARFLDAHPEKRSIAAYFLVREALITAYPCKG